jgi:hypothetical protein
VPVLGSGRFGTDHPKSISVFSTFASTLAVGLRAYDVVSVVTCFLQSAWQPSA